MRRILICVILGTAVVISGWAFYRSRLDIEDLNHIYELIKYAELGADPNGLYSGYTVEELGENYRKPSRFLNRTEIEDFPVVCQFPELPTGCEITCAAALLNYLGFNADKITLADMYMRQSDNFRVDEDGIIHGPDPDYCFAGDPYDRGYGCYENVIKDAVNSYFQDCGETENYTAVTLPGVNTADLEKLLDEGVPVIVWASGGMDAYRYSEQSTWKITGTSKEITWKGNSHTLVLVGYDPNAYYFMDCGKASAIVPYSKDAFSKRFDENGRRACVIKINAVSPQRADQ